MRSLSPIDLIKKEGQGLIFPRLENIHNSLPKEFIHKHFAADLVTYYVCEQDANYRYLRKEDIEEVEGFESIHINAINNLISFVGDRIELNGESEYAMMLTVDGEHEATLLLFDKFWIELEIRLGGSLLVFAPSHDLIFLALENSILGRNRLMEIRNKYVTEMPTSILGSTFLKRVGGIWIVAE